MQKEENQRKNEFRKRLYAWTLRLVKFIESVPRGMISEVLGKQLLRSGTSVLANHTEAYAASSKRDFINFFSHALKSANESKIWLALLRDTDRGEKSELNWPLQELTEIANILASSILTMRKRR